MTIHLIRAIKALVFSSLLMILSGCLVTREQIRGSESPQGAAFGGTPPERGSAGGGGGALTNSRLAEVEAFVRELNGRVGTLENESREKWRSLEGTQQEKWAEIENRLTAVVEELSLIKADMEKQARALTESRSAPSSGPASAPATATSAAGAAPNAFDQAEKLFNEKKWQQAILKYQEYRDRNPRGRHFAEATYKIGVCFQELGMAKEARTFYEEVIARFPNTPQSRRSQTRMRALRP